MGNIIKYGNYDAEAAAEEKADLESGGADFLKLKVGRTQVRILPPSLGSGRRSPFVVVYQHYIEFPGRTVRFVCPRLMAKKSCEACAQADKLKGSKSTADQDAAKSFFARRRIYCNAIDRADEAHGPQVMAFGKMVHEQLVALRTDEDAGGDYTNPVDGFDIIIERTGEKKNDTKYAVRPSRKSSPLNEDAATMQEWIDTQKNLIEFARVPSAEEIKKLLEGDDDADSPPPRGGSGKGRRADDDAIDTDGAEAD